MQRIVLGADHAGYRLKELIAARLREKGHVVQDVGCFSEASVDYPAIAALLAAEFQRQAAQFPTESVRGVLCCGSGIGVGIAANRFSWLRAVEAHDHNTVTLSRRHNDSNVLCLGARVIAPELADDLLKTWLTTPFEGERHQQRVDLMGTLPVESTAHNPPKEISAC